MLLASRQFSWALTFKCLCDSSFYIFVAVVVSVVVVVVVVSIGANKAAAPFQVGSQDFKASATTWVCDNTENAENASQ